MSLLSKALHSAAAPSLLSTLLAITESLVAANNPSYAPVLQATAGVLQNEINSLAAGNAPTPHALPAPAGIQTVVSPSP